MCGQEAGHGEPASKLNPEAKTLSYTLDCWSQAAGVAGITNIRQPGREEALQLQKLALPEAVRLYPTS